MDKKSQLLALLVVFLWGFNFVVIRWGIENMHPITFTAYRFLFAALPVVFFVKRPEIPMRIMALYGVLMGAGVWGVMNFAVFLGMPAGMASVLLQLDAFLAILIAVWWFKETLTLNKMIGTGIAFVGFLLIVLFKSDNVTSIGIVLVVVAAIVFTICHAMLKIYQPKAVISFTAWTSLFVPVPLLLVSIVYFMANDLPIEPLLTLPSWKGWVAVLFQAYIVTLFGYAVWADLIVKHGLANVVLFLLVTPIAGLFFGWLLYNETLTTAEFVGAVLVIAGLLVVDIPIRRKKSYGRGITRDH